MRRSAWACWAVLFVFLLPAPARAAAQAQNSARLGDVVVHYSAVRSDFFAPQVARRYGFVRSSTRAVLTVSLLRGDKVAVPGQVTASAEYPSGQPFAIPLDEIREGNAIYYLGEFRIQTPVTLKFHIDVRPTGAQTAGRVSFDQSFY